MKVKHILILFLISLIILAVGGLFKVLHWPGGAWFFLIGFLMEFIVYFLAIWKILTIEKFRDFLNS